MKHTLLVIAAAALALSACTSQKSNGPLNLALVGKPTDQTTELAQLQRYRGQTQFLDREKRWRGMPGRPEAPGGAAPRTPGPADSRDQQESDVFKVWRSWIEASLFDEPVPRPSSGELCQKVTSNLNFSVARRHQVTRLTKCTRTSNGIA